MENHADRRKYARVQLCAYGVGTVCIVMQGQKRCQLDLVDISSGGARLRVKDSLPEFVDNRLSLSIHGIKDNGRLQNLVAQIRWRSDKELGVQFENQLDMPLSDLQRLVG